MSEEKNNRHHHSEHEYSEHEHSRKKISLFAFWAELKPVVRNGILFAIAFLLCILAIFIFKRYENRIFSDYSPEKVANAYLGETDPNELYLDGEIYTPKKNITSYLIIGIDKDGEFKASRKYDNDQQCDFLALIVFDSDAKTYRILHINRDTMTPVNMLGVNGKVMSTRVMQIALSHTYGNGLERSCQNTADAVSNLLFGMPVDKYYAFTMSAVGEIADFVGGVPITIEEDLTEADPSFTEGAEVVLTKDTALSFVRARMEVSDGSNISRMGRQKQFIRALMEIFDGQEDADVFVMDAMKRIAKYSLTNAETRDINNITESFYEYSFDGLISPEGEAMFDGQYIQYHVDDEKLKQLVLDTFYDKKD